MNRLHEVAAGALIAGSLLAGAHAAGAQEGPPVGDRFTQNGDGTNTMESGGVVDESTTTTVVNQVAGDRFTHNVDGSNTMESGGVVDTSATSSTSAQPESTPTTQITVTSAPEGMPAITTTVPTEAVTHVQGVSEQKESNSQFPSPQEAAIGVALGGVAIGFGNRKSRQDG